MLDQLIFLEVSLLLVEVFWVFWVLTFKLLPQFKISFTFLQFLIESWSWKIVYVLGLEISHEIDDFSIILELVAIDNTAELLQCKLLLYQDLTIMQSSLNYRLDTRYQLRMNILQLLLNLVIPIHNESQNQCYFVGDAESWDWAWLVQSGGGCALTHNWIQNDHFVQYFIFVHDLLLLLKTLIKHLVRIPARIFTVLALIVWLE